MHFFKKFFSKVNTLTAIRFIFIFIIYLLYSNSSVAQILTPDYPTPAEDITRGLNQTKLTVKLGFASACSGTQVVISFPSSVTYIPGSISQSGTTISGAAITENNITNLNAPVFTVSGITSAGDLSFTIKRKAGCGTLSAGKDTITVTGSCGSVKENGSNINSYNLFSPSLSLIPPVTIPNALLNTGYSRTVSVTNGGNGCLDTLLYYVVYAGAGITSTNAGNAVVANGISFTPVSSHGDTLFYKLYGNTLFGGDNFFCNGETVSIVENIWSNAATACQVASGTSTVNMANGVRKYKNYVIECKSRIH